MLNHQQLSEFKMDLGCDDEVGVERAQEYLLWYALVL